MYLFSCVLWAIFWFFSLRSENASKTHPKSSHDKFKTASEKQIVNFLFGNLYAIAMRYWV